MTLNKIITNIQENYYSPDLNLVKVNGLYVQDKRMPRLGLSLRFILRQPNPSDLRFHGFGYVLILASDMLRDASLEVKEGLVAHELSHLIREAGEYSVDNDVIKRGLGKQLSLIYRFQHEHDHRRSAIKLHYTPEEVLNIMSTN